jgi:vacuolar-type H+-ATPase subunit I/STV1
MLWKNFWSYLARKMQIEKTVFIVFFAGDWSRMKITKICDAFGANRYHFPEDARQQQQMTSEVLILGPIKTNYQIHR